MAATISVLVHGARGLSCGKFDKNAYCEVTIGSRTQTTKPDKGKASSPVWGDKLDFKFEGESVVEFKVFAKSMMGGKVELGEGRKDLMKAYLEGMDKGEVSVLKDNSLSGYVSVTLTNPDRQNQNAENEPPSTNEVQPCPPNNVDINHNSGDGHTNMIPQHPDNNNPPEWPSQPPAFPQQDQQQNQNGFTPPQFPESQHPNMYPNMYPPYQPYDPSQQYPYPNPYPQQPGQFPPAHPNQYPQQPGQFPPPHPNQYPQQPGQFPPAHPNQYPQQPGQFPPAYPNQYPQQPGQFPPAYPYQYPQQPGQFPPAYANQLPPQQNNTTSHDRESAPTSTNAFPSETIDLLGMLGNNHQSFPGEVERKLSEASNQSG